MRLNKRLVCIFCVSLLVIYSINNVYAEDEGEEDEEDEEDEGNQDDDAEDIGVLAISLFGLGSLYVLTRHLFLLSLKLPKKEERYSQTKKFMMEFQKKTRKPLSWLHYLAEAVAFGVFFLHFLPLLGEDDEKVIFGLITGVLLGFFVVTGLIAKFLNKFAKKAKKIPKLFYTIHTNILFFLAVFLLHFIHIGA